MSTRSLRARLDRLKQFAIPEIGKDRDRDRRRRDELFSRTYSPGLTLREEAEYAQLRASFEGEDRQKPNSVDAFRRHLRGELTDAEKAKLAEPPDPNNPLAASILALRAAIARRRDGKNYLIIIPSEWSQGIGPWGRHDFAVACLRSSYPRALRRSCRALGQRLAALL